MKLRTLDLFAGIGGISLGLERTGGFETVAFCEIDKAAQKVLNKHWPDVPIFEDVKSLSAKEIDGPINVITGGFPCQDLSVAGRGAGLEGARSGLWWEFHRLIKEAKPKWVVIENVAVLRSRGLDQVLGSLAEIGYDAQWHCIPASAVGAPHRRDRIWIVAYPGHGSGWDFGSSQEGHHASSERATDSDTPGGSGEQPALVADPNNQRPGTPEHGANSKWTETKQGRQEHSFIRSSGCGETLADTSSSGLQGGKRLRDHLEETLRGWKTAPRPASERCPVSGGTLYSWSVEPSVGRVADGVPGRVDRLKQLGNAVVPQIPEIIGRAILQAT
jgi:DNA (cytosine-5)-methyltransferase 1